MSHPLSNQNANITQAGVFVCLNCRPTANLGHTSELIRHSPQPHQGLTQHSGHGGAGGVPDKSGKTKLMWQENNFYSSTPLNQKSPSSKELLRGIEEERKDIFKPAEAGTEGHRTAPRFTCESVP